jgi:hypothetical protein
VEDKGIKDRIFSYQERIKVVTGRVCSLGKPTGIDIIWPFLKWSGLKPLGFERGDKPNRKGSLAGTPLEPSYNYPWNFVYRLSGDY